MSKLVMPINEEEYKRDCRLMYEKGRTESVSEVKRSLKEAGYSYDNGMNIDDNIGSVLLAEYAKGYSKGYEDKCSIVKSKAEDDRASLLAYICKKYNIPLVDMNATVDEWEYETEQGKERE